MKISQEELLDFLFDNEIRLDDVIDAVIEEEAIIGVGLITLGEQMEAFALSKISVH